MRCYPTPILPLLTSSQICFPSIASFLCLWSSKSALKKLQILYCLKLNAKDEWVVQRTKMSNPPGWHDWLCLHIHQEDQFSLLEKKKREFFKSSIDFATNQINYSTSVNPAEIHSRVWCTCFCEENVTFHIGVVSHQRDTQLNKQLTLHSKRWTKVDMTWAEQSSVENRLPLYAWRTAYCFLQGNKGSFLRIAAPPWFQPNWNQRKIS